MFVNFLKMKLSAILGVAHMVLGIFLKGVNTIFEKDIIEFIFIFIPQIILMVILFGYMDAFIFIKWNINYKNKEYLALDIKSFLMNIFLKFGKLPSTEVKEDSSFFTDRETLEKYHLYILLLAILFIILMHFPKMLLSFLIAKRKYHKNNNTNINQGLGIINNNEMKMKIN